MLPILLTPRRPTRKTKLGRRSREANAQKLTQNGQQLFLPQPARRASKTLVVFFKIYKILRPHKQLAYHFNILNQLKAAASVLRLQTFFFLMNLLYCEIAVFVNERELLASVYLQFVFLKISTSHLVNVESK